MAVLGAESRVFFTEHNRCLDTMPPADLVTAIEVKGQRLLPMPGSRSRSGPRCRRRTRTTRRSIAPASPPAGLQAKLQALRCYRTQIRDGRYCWSIEPVRARAKMRGLESNLGFAELFHVMRMIVR